MGMVEYVRAGSKARIMSGDTPAWITNSKRASYIKAVCLSAPPWVDKRVLRAIWETEMNGILHVLDHIIPVIHPRVCGLTVPWNLQIISWRVNATKGNKWVPEQRDLFLELELHPIAFPPPPNERITCCNSESSK